LWEMQYEYGGKGWQRETILKRLAGWVAKCRYLVRVCAGEHQALKTQHNMCEMIHKRTQHNNTT
jgi:hypothetical protein